MKASHVNLEDMLKSGANPMEIFEKMMGEDKECPCPNCASDREHTPKTYIEHLDLLHSKSDIELIRNQFEVYEIVAPISEGENRKYRGVGEPHVVVRNLSSVQFPVTEDGTNCEPYDMIVSMVRGGKVVYFPVYSVHMRKWTEEDREAFKKTFDK